MSDKLENSASFINTVSELKSEFTTADNADRLVTSEQAKALEKRILVATQTLMQEQSGPSDVVKSIVSLPTLIRSKLSLTLLAAGTTVATLFVMIIAITPSSDVPSPNGVVAEALALNDVDLTFHELGLTEDELLFLETI